MRIKHTCLTMLAALMLAGCAGQDGGQAPWLCQVGENLCKQRCEPMRAEQAIECRQSCERNCQR